MRKKYRGSCLCAGVTFEVGGFGSQVANCHCSMCRKFHGAACGTLVSVTELKWLSGQDLMREYVAQNGTVRTFCSACGSSLGFRIKDAHPDKIEIAIALFDDEIPVKVDAQIFTQYKADWSVLQSDLPAFPEHRTVK